MKYKAIISGHIWNNVESPRGKDIEILKMIHNDEAGADIFCDIDHALLDEIDTGDSHDYYFIAIVESKFVERQTLEGIDYDTEYHVKEIKSMENIYEEEGSYGMRFEFIEPAPTMKLDGGINIFSIEGKRYLIDKSPLGRKVSFLNDNGHESEREEARKYFRKGQTLTVKEIYVGSSSSEVEFEEVSNKRFNTVMFADLIED